MKLSLPVVAALRQHRLFEQCSDALLAILAEGAHLQTYAVGDALKGYNDEPFLCIVLEGEAAVHTHDEHNDLLLRILREGDIFGVANLFGKAPTITHVTAQKPTTALCIGEEAMRRAIGTDGDLAMRYIDFLSDRIRFLNRRIATLTAGSAERRLAAWLDTVMPDSTDRIVLPFPVNRLADTLGLGRASLYRAFDDLTASGYLTRDGKTVILHDRTAMRQANGLG